jgi:hypothetical protein
MAGHYTPPTCHPERSEGSVNVMGGRFFLPTVVRMTVLGQAPFQGERWDGVRPLRQGTCLFSYLSADSDSAGHNYFLDFPGSSGVDGHDAGAGVGLHVSVSSA